MKFVKRKEYGLASRLKKSAVSYAMMAPYMIVFILLTVIPVIAAICLSFTYFNMLFFLLKKHACFRNYNRASQLSYFIRFGVADK